MSPEVLAALAFVGLAAGFLAGLVGIGGGVLIVPFLYFFYGHEAWSGVAVPFELHVTLAHATSLFIIVPTAVLGTISYARAGLVAWRPALPIAVASLAGAQAGVHIALLVPGEWLKVGFGAFLIVSGVQLGRRRSPAEPEVAAKRGGIVALLGVGVLVGALSALMGVGGGLMAVPLLLHLAGIGIRQVAATSLAIICFAAPAGTIAYVVRGWDLAALPPGSAGYVHVAAAIPILAGSLLSVRLGTLVNRRMATRALRRLFAILLILLGLRLLLESAARLPV